MESVKIRNRVKIPLDTGDAEFITYHGLADGKEHLVVAFGDWPSNPIVNVRLHSECMTGEVFGSCKCECSEQLKESMEQFSQKSGLLVYLRQEGRGIGLYNKIDAYHLQNQGLDTVEANRALNLNDDQRDYKVAAEMLKALGVSKVTLYSNNPLKKQGLEDHGVVVVKRECTGVHIKKHNYHYLKTKVKRCGHDIKL